MNPKNLKEFKALIKRYESITLEEIKKKAIEITDFSNVASELTGFGTISHCLICSGFYCNQCIYYIRSGDGCSGEINGKTYDRISNADTPTKLRNAFRARAKHMKTLI